jgi:hypothetical protein
LLKIKKLERSMKFRPKLLTVLICLFLLSCTVSAAPAGKADPISGEWDAVFHLANGDLHFTYHLKLDGDKVTGSVTTPHGDSQITDGSWKSGKLRFTLQAMKITGELQDGKLVGEFDHGGEMNGAWGATRKR